ncbi:MAG: DUF5320 domain-containing protein [bacterium]
MPNKDGTGPAGKGSGTGRRRGACRIRKSVGSNGVNADASVSEENNPQKVGRERTKGLGPSKGLQRKAGKTSEFSNPEWWK